MGYLIDNSTIDHQLHSIIDYWSSNGPTEVWLAIDIGKGILSNSDGDWPEIGNTRQ